MNSSSSSKSAASVASQPDCSTAQSFAGRRDLNAEARTVERIYRFADALKATEKALDAVPTAARGGRSDLDVLLDRQWFLGDFDQLAKQVREVADQWQSEIDGEDGK